MTAPRADAEIYEGSDFQLTLTHMDVDGAPVTPTSLRWRIDDIMRRIEVSDWQEVDIGSPATQNVIVVPAELNTLTFRGDSLREVVVEAEINGLVAVDRYVYRIVELTGIE